jgi:hypothetical protein
VQGGFDVAQAPRRAIDELDGKFLLTCQHCSLALFGNGFNRCACAIPQGAAEFGSFLFESVVKQTGIALSRQIRFHVFCVPVRISDSLKRFPAASGPAKTLPLEAVGVGLRGMAAPRHRSAS